MANWLGKIFNIRPGEWKRLLSVAFILVVACLGTVWAQNATYATFVKEVGQDAIIWVQIFSSVLSIPFMFLYAAYVDRMDNNRLFIYIIALGGLIKLFSLALSWAIPPAWAFLALYILSLIWLAAWNAQFATYVNELFDIQAGKRAWPVILAAASLASILGGFTLQYLTERLNAAAFVGFWLFTDLASIAALWRMTRFVKRKKSAASEAKVEKEEGGWLRGTKEGFSFTMQSGLLRWIAIGTLAMMALMGLMEYYYNAVLAVQFENPAKYAGFLGMLEGISGAVGLLILFFGVGWMTRVWGVKNANLVFPLLNFLVCLGLTGVSPAHVAALYAASLAFVSRSGLRSGLQEPMDALLFNAVPLRLRGRARAFVGGIVTPAGTLFSAVLLWILSGANLPLRGAILLLAAFYVADAFFVRREYTQALVRMLEEEDYSFILSSGASKLNISDPSSLGRLREKLEKSATHEMRVFMTQLIAQVGGADAVPTLAPAVKAATEGRTRAAMLEVMSAAGLHDAKMRDLCESMLADPDPQARLAAAAGLEQILGPQDRRLQAQWLNMLNDPHPQVAFYALQALAAGDFYKWDAAVQKLDALLRGDADEKKKAIQILGSIPNPQAIERLLRFLRDEDGQIRLEAALNMARLPLPLGDALDAKIIEHALPLMNDPLASARQAAVQLLGKFRNERAYALLVSALSDKNPQVSAAAADLLAEIGEAALPALQAELASPNAHARKMSAAVLSRIAPRQFGSLIEKSVADNLNAIYQNVSLEQALTPYQRHRAVRVQLAALRENNRGLIDEILYLLSAVHPRQILDRIGESIRSDSAETRNLALEALESLTSPKTAALIVSLFEPSLAPAQLLQMGRGTLNVEEFSPEEALEKLLSSSESDVHDFLAAQTAGDVSCELLESGVSLSPQIPLFLEKFSRSSHPLVRRTAQSALKRISEREKVEPGGSAPLSTIDKMSILKETPFFRNVPVYQLAALAEAAQEKRCSKDETLFKTGDEGGSLFVIVEGKVNIAQEKRGAFTTLASLGANSYFGEMSLFDRSPRSTAAVAAEGSLLLELGRDPVFDLIAQNPDWALEIINVLSRRIRETSARLADASRSLPRELHKLFDQFN